MDINLDNIVAYTGRSKRLNKKKPVLNELIYDCTLGEEPVYVMRNVLVDLDVEIPDVEVEVIGEKIVEKPSSSDEQVDKVIECDKPPEVTKPALVEQGLLDNLVESTIDHSQFTSPLPVEQVCKMKFLITSIT